MTPASDGGAGDPGTPRVLLDRAILDAFAGGSVEALAAVYDRYSRAVWSVTMSVLSNRSLAEDATQETFLRAWRAADTYDPDRDIAPWLFTIARRTAIDVYRREARPTQGGHGVEQDVVVRMPGIERAYETWEVRSAVDELPAEERDVVRMSHFEEMTHREIAEALDLPVGTVKSRSHRAHRRLADRLAHLVNGGEW
jgi:RNA polymerase sigma-70 factor (ECF subfamily)